MSVEGPQSGIDPNLKKPRRKTGGALGNIPFVPDEKQKGLVRMLIGCRRPVDHIRRGIINPATGKAIDAKTFAAAFAHEIELGELELDAMAGMSIYKGLKEGNVAMTIWTTKNAWGWRDYPEDRNSKIDPAGTNVKHEIVVEGGLPKGATAANPGGDQAREFRERLAREDAEDAEKAAKMPANNPATKKPLP